MEKNKQTSEKMKHIRIIIAFFIVIFVMVVVIWGKSHKRSNPNSLYPNNAIITQMQNYPSVTTVPMMTTVPLQNNNTTNTQLDQDLQTMQESLDALDTDVANTDQSLNNQSADISQQ